MLQTRFCLLLSGCALIILSACQRSAPLPSTPNIGATITTERKNDAQINLSDHGKTFTYHLTDRFTVFLDDEKYPVKDLTCTPEGIIGYISNGSLGGPDSYPIMFEAVSAGICRLEDRNFHLDIVVNP